MTFLVEPVEGASRARLTALPTTQDERDAGIDPASIKPAAEALLRDLAPSGYAMDRDCVARKQAGPLRPLLALTAP